MGTEKETTPTHSTTILNPHLSVGEFLLIEEIKTSLMPDSKAKANALCDIGIKYVRRGDIPAAQRVLHQLTPTSDNRFPAIYNLTVELVRHFVDRGDFDQAFALVENHTSLNYFEEIEYTMFLQVISARSANHGYFEQAERALTAMPNTHDGRICKSVAWELIAIAKINYGLAYEGFGDILFRDPKPLILDAFRDCHKEFIEAYQEGRLRDGSDQDKIFLSLMKEWTKEMIFRAAYRRYREEQERDIIRRTAEHLQLRIKDKLISPISD